MCVAEKQALETALATKADIARLEANLDHETASLKWMMSVLLAIANFAKQISNPRTFLFFSAFAQRVCPPIWRQCDR